VGGDGPAGLPLAVQERIDQADQLWGGARLLAFWSAHPADKVVIGADIADQAARLTERGETRVVVLASGDPGFYGMVATLRRWLGPEDLDIVPHVSALQLAFARIGVEWSEAALTSVHARPLSELVGWARRAPKLGVLTDDRHTPGCIAQMLLEAGVADCRAVVAENLGLPEERLIDTRLSALAGQTFAPLNVLLLLHDADWLPVPPFAPRPEDAYQHRRGLITKADVRVLSLARLALRETDTAWDIGAGSGAVSVEMAELAWRGQMYAVEPDQENLGYLRANTRRYGTLNVHLVEGRAPEALEGLPAPDAVFVGGTGGAMEVILAHLARIARPGCRVVLTLATLENLGLALRQMKSLGWSPQVTQVSLAYDAPVGELTRLAPLNPIFIVNGRLPS